MSFVTRGIGLSGTAAALLATAGLGLSVAVTDTVEPYYGDSTGVVRIVRVSVDTGEVVGIFIIGRTEDVTGFGEVTILFANDVLGAERLGFASIDPMPIAEAGVVSDSTAIVPSRATVVT